MDKYFAHINALQPFYKNQLRVPYCPRCNKQADYLSITISNMVMDRGFFFTPNAQGFCSGHIEKEAKKRNMVVLETEAELKKRIEQSRNKQQAEYENAVERNKAREAEILKQYGEILRLSGLQGQMFEKVDGSFFCKLNDGTIIIPCCPMEGARLIDNRIRGHNPKGHSPGCIKGGK